MFENIDGFDGGTIIACNYGPGYGAAVFGRCFTQDYDVMLRNVLHVLQLDSCYQLGDCNRSIRLHRDVVLTLFQRRRCFDGS